MTVERVKESESESEKSSAKDGGSFVHSQVRRIRDEDMRIGEGTGEGLSAWDLDLKMALLHLSSPDAGAILCSPLGNKTRISSPLLR